MMALQGRRGRDRFGSVSVKSTDLLEAREKLLLQERVDVGSASSWDARERQRLAVVEFV